MDSYRHVNVFLFTLAALINSFPTQALAAVSPIMQSLYQLTELEANFNSLIYPITYIFMILPANYIIDKHGLKRATLFCEMCMLVGYLLHTLINFHFYFFLAGTFSCSLGFCFMISSANKVANTWFPEVQIYFVNSIVVFAIFASDALGTFCSAIFINQESTKETVFTFFLYLHIVLAGIQLAMAFFFRGAPKHFQNYSSAVQRSTYSADLKALIGNRNYLYLFGSMTCVFGSLTVIFVILPWYSRAYEFESITNGVIIIIANAVGCVGCIGAGKCAAQPPRYLNRCRVFVVGFVVALIGMGIGFEVGSVGMVYAAGGLTGLFAYPYLTTITDFASQTTFPVGEATSVGSLLFGGQFLGFILAIALSLWMGQSRGDARATGIGVTILAALSFVWLLFAKEDSRRTAYEREKQHCGQIASSLLSE